MKKILICCTYFSPNISGVTIYVEHLINSLKNNYKINVLTSRYRPDSPKKEQIDGVEVKRSEVGFNIGKGVFMPMYWWDAYWAIKDCDYVNCHMPMIESWVVALEAKILGKKVILTHHCEFGFSGTVANRVVAVISFPFHCISYLLADKIVAYTQDYAKHGSIFLKMFAKKVDYILPPIVLGKENKTYTLELQKKLEKNKKHIGFAGRIAWEKGLHLLLGVMENNLNYQLVIAGPFKGVVGDDTFSRQKDRFEKLGERVIFLGALSRDQLTSFYKSIDVLVLPSTDNLETFGIVQAEAMLCGTPVVASDLPGVRVPVGLTGMGEVCKLNDSMDLEKKLNIVLQQRKKYIKDEKYINDIFDINNFIKFYEKIFA